MITGFVANSKNLKLSVAIHAEHLLQTTVPNAFRESSRCSSRSLCSVQCPSIRPGVSEVNSLAAAPSYSNRLPFPAGFGHRNYVRPSCHAVILCLRSWAALWLLLGGTSLLHAQGTAFSYQGRLSDGGAPANGTYEFEFTLWDGLSGGNLASATVLGTPGGVFVTNGLFTAVLDFGVGALNGAPRWLELQVRTNGAVAAFATVTPRQAIPVVPYAVFAGTAGNVVAGTIGSAALAANAVTADKIAGAAVVKGINNLKDAVTIQGGSNLVVSTVGNTITLSGTTGPAWGLSGNSGLAAANFLGTTDQKPLELRVGGVRALRLEPNASGRPNVIGGHTNNAVAAGVVSAVIAGGGDPASSGSNYVGASYGTIGGGRRNSIQANSDSAVLGGGYANTIRSNSLLAVLSGGVSNIIDSASYGVIGGGANNVVQAVQSSILGGYNNIIQSNAINSAILAGSQNIVSNDAAYATIVGGYQNIVGPAAAFAHVGGGRQNTNRAIHAAIGGGYQNTIQSGSVDSVIAGGRENVIQPKVGYGVLGGGLRNVLHSGASYSSVVGGFQNVVQTNSISGAILGGFHNVIQTNTTSALIAGGSYHVIFNNVSYGAIPGGYQNAVGGHYSLAAGNRAKANHRGTFVWADATAADLASTAKNQFLIRATGGVGIGTNKPASLLHVWGTVTATNFVGSGAGLSNLPPTSFTGVLATNQIPNLDAAKLTSGRFADARLSTNVALLNGTNAFTGTDRFAGVVFVTNANNQFTGAFTGNGAGLTNLPPAALTGVLGDTQLPASVVYRPELLAVTNGLSARLVATNSALVAALNSQTATLNTQVTALGTQLTNLNTQFAALTNGSPASIPTGVPVVSSDPADPDFLANGLQMFFTVPAPAWVNGSATSVPTARSSHSAVWTGQQLLVWGGDLGAGNYTAGGAAYNPTSDQWQSIATFLAPTARAGHTAVWTGTEMIIWGGSGTSGFATNHGRYHLTGATWADVPTNNPAPAKRDGHVAVWTGSRMVIFGGRNGTGLLDTGGAYDPVGNTWSALPVIGVPEARRFATAVWTGTQMIVWGGQGDPNELASGGRLVSDGSGVPQSWLPTSTVGAPTARVGHSALWTGSKMIIWGGQSGGANQNDGALYDPVTDLWTALPLTGAPSARAYHVAVWSGSEMLVFSGEDATGALPTGSAYDPLRNRWRTLDTSTGALARSHSTAIWSGTELVLFGGISSGSPIAVPQRLKPQSAWYFYRKP